jgi:hypothetical protein
MHERGKLARKEPIGAEGDIKVFEGETALKKIRILEDTLLNTVSNSIKIYERFPCIVV